MYLFDDMCVGQTWHIKARTDCEDAFLAAKETLVLIATKMGPESTGSAACYALAVNGVHKDALNRDLQFTDMCRIYHDHNRVYYGYNVLYEHVSWEELPLYLGYSNVGRILPAIISGELWIPQDQWDVRPNVNAFLERHTDD